MISRVSIEAKRTLVFSAFILGISSASFVTGDSSGEKLDSWHALTLDNDLVLGNDSGYTNGFYYSNFGSLSGGGMEPPLLTRPLQWMFDASRVVNQFNVTTFGQTMVTPEDITVRAPQPDDLPYSGLLFVYQASVKDYGNYADKTGVLIGLVGPSSQADRTQILIHKMVDEPRPQGWEYQLRDEPVFQLSRGRVWKGWQSETNNADFLVGADAKLGTYESSVTASTMLRFGRDLHRTYSSALLARDRATNPVNIESGWYGYFATSATLLANAIYLDGNTFKDSPSVDYGRFQFNTHLGFTYAWDDFSVSMAVNNINLFPQNGDYSELRGYGSLTLLWRM